MEKLIKEIIKEIIKESINYNKKSDTVYFGNKQSADEALVDNTSSGLRIKKIDTGANLTLNDTNAIVKRDVKELNQPDKDGFTKSRKLAISTKTNSATGRIYINTYNLYNKVDLKHDIIGKYNNLPTDILYYAKLAKNQYQAPASHSNWAFNYSASSIATDAANDFLDDSRINSLINKFSPEIIICPDSSSPLNQAILNILTNKFSSAEVFSTTKISTATFFDESAAATDLKVRRAAQNATPLASDPKKTVADSLDSGSSTRRPRTQQEIDQLNKTGIMDPSSIQRVNSEILSKAFFTMFDEIDKNSPARPGTLKVKIHEVGSLSSMQAWRNYLSGLHAVTYSSTRIPVSTVSTADGGIINIRDLMFDSAIMYSSMMYLYLTQDLAKKYGRPANRQWLQTNKINENKKRLKENYTLNKKNEVQKYIGDLEISIQELEIASSNSQTPEQRQAIDEQIAVLKNLLNLMNQAADTANYTELNNIKSQIDAIQQPDQRNITDYSIIAGLISSIVLQSYEGLLTKAYDFIKNQEKVEIEEVQLIVEEWFKSVFQEIVNSSEIMADEDDDEYDRVLRTFNKSIEKATKMLTSQSKNNAAAEASALETISKNPEVLYVIMEKIVDYIREHGNTAISDEVKRELEGGTNEIDINSLALRVIENIHDVIPDSVEETFTTYEDIKFNKSKKDPGKIVIEIKPNDTDSKYRKATQVTISISTLFNLDIISINKDSLADTLLSGAAFGSTGLSNYLKKIRGSRLKRILIIDDNIATGATLAGIKRDILDKVENYQKQNNITIDINFESGKTKSVSADKFPEIMASQDVSTFKGRSDIMSNDILLKDIICITPMIV